MRIRKLLDHIGRVFVLGAMLSCATTQRTSPPTQPTSPPTQPTSPPTQPTSPPEATGPVQGRYPADMRARRIEGHVILVLTVLPDGSTSDIVVVTSGGPEFDRAAQDAMRSARFLPAMRDGIAVPSRIRWTYRFRIDNDSDR